MEKLNARRRPPVDLGYLLYHDKEEEHHSQATLDELYEDFTEPWFDAEKFLSAAEEMLTRGVQAYYESQLESLPDKDETWPLDATEPRRFDPKTLKKVADACSCGLAPIACVHRPRFGRWSGSRASPFRFGRWLAVRLGFL